MSTLKIDDDVYETLHSARMDGVESVLAVLVFHAGPRAGEEIPLLTTRASLGGPDATVDLGPAFEDAAVAMLPPGAPGARRRGGPPRSAAGPRAPLRPGSPHASDDYVSALRKLGMCASMSRRGNRYDNAVVESFFNTLKLELGDRFDSQPEAHRPRASQGATLPPPFPGTRLITMVRSA